MPRFVAGPHCRRGWAAGIVYAMACIVFTSLVQRFLDLPDVRTSRATLRAAFDQRLAEHPRLAGYLLGEQRHLRANVVVFSVTAGVAITAS